MLFPILLFFQLSTLDTWRAEIEQLDHRKVVVLTIAKEMEPPADEAVRAIVTQLFLTSGFPTQFARAEAMSITNGGYQLILINPELTPPKAYDAVLAHELGHLWLKAQGYPSPIYQAGDAGCLAVTTGDIVQHILIRTELDRRQIEWRPNWIENLTRTSEHLEKNGTTQPIGPICQRLSQLELWIDVKLGMAGGNWNGLERFERAMAASFPELKLAAEEMAGHLKTLQVDDKAVHRKALQYTFTKLKSVGLEIDRKPNETKSP